MEAIVFIIQIFFTTCAVLKIGEYSRIFPGSGCRIFGHVMCLEQSWASENIWWIVWFDIFALPCDIVNMYMCIQMVVVYTVQSGWQKWRVLHPIEIVRLSILFCYMTDVHSVHCSLKCGRFPSSFEIYCTCMQFSIFDWEQCVLCIPSILYNWL